MTVEVEGNPDRRGQAPGRLVEPGRVGAHSYSGKRVRDEVREGAAVVAFSLLASTIVALVVTLCTRLAG